MIFFILEAIKFMISNFYKDRFIFGIIKAYEILLPRIIAIITWHKVSFVYTKMDKRWKLIYKV